MGKTTDVFKKIYKNLSLALKLGVKFIFGADIDNFIYLIWQNLKNFIF